MFSVLRLFSLLLLGAFHFAHAAEDRFLEVKSSMSASGDKRVALVIGNAAYKSGPLVNPVNDARAMASRLRTLGFDVI